MGMPDPTLRRLADRLDARATANDDAAGLIGNQMDDTRMVHMMLAAELRALAAELRAG